MKKLFKSFNRGEKGFTLIELLIVIAILGIMAAVAIPLVSGALANGRISAANTEVASVKAAAQAYALGTNGTSVTSATLMTDGDLSVTPKVLYTLSIPDVTITLVTALDGTALPSGYYPNTKATFNGTTQQWAKP